MAKEINKNKIEGSTLEELKISYDLACIAVNEFDNLAKSVDGNYGADYTGQYNTYLNKKLEYLHIKSLIFDEIIKRLDDLAKC